MKKTVFVVVGLVCVVMFGACKSEGDSGEPDYNACMSVSLSSYESGAKVSNTVVAGGLQYCECLEFSSGNGGAYLLYKEEGDNKILVTENPFSDEGGELPEVFTYDESIGEVSVIIDGKPIKTYLFKNGETVYMAAEIVQADDSEEDGSLFRSWSTSEGCFTFNDKGAVSFSFAESSADLQHNGTYINNGGYIKTNGNICFCWTSTENKNKLYFKAYELEPSIERQGRAIGIDTEGGITEFNAGRLMFARTQQ